MNDKLVLLQTAFASQLRIFLHTRQYLSKNLKMSHIQNSNKSDFMYSVLKSWMFCVTVVVYDINNNKITCTISVNISRSVNLKTPNHIRNHNRDRDRDHDKKQ